MNHLRTIVENTLVPHSAFATATEQLDRCFRFSEGASEPICLPILGESRTGKSRSLESFLINHPKSRDGQGAHIPVLVVKVPPKPTVKGLAEEMLTALGDPMPEKSTEQGKTRRLLKLLRECGTRMLIIDEFQHFVDKGSAKIAYHVADWLKIIADESKVALVVSGLPSCTKVLDVNEQLEGRFMSPVLLPRFSWTADAHRSEFVGILTAFHGEMASQFSIPEFQTDEMAFRFHCATGGLIGYLAKTLRIAVWDAVDAKRRNITLEDLQAAHRLSVRLKGTANETLDPFSRDFKLEPTKELLDRVSKIGVRDELAINGRGRPKSKAVKEEAAS